MLLFLKLAFMASIPVYGLVGWLLSRHPAPAQMPDAGMLQSMTYGLMALFALQALIIEPLLSRQLISQRRGYDKNTMIVKLAFFESGAIYGLILTLISHDVSYVAGFGAAAFLLMVVRVPVPAR